MEKKLQKLLVTIDQKLSTEFMAYEIEFLKELKVDTLKKLNAIFAAKAGA